MHGDHLTLLNVCRAYRGVAWKKRREWCNDNFVNARTLSHADHVCEQLRHHCEGMQLPLERCAPC